MNEIETRLTPTETSSAIVRKLGAMTLLSGEEVSFLEGLQGNKVDVPKDTDFIEIGGEMVATFIVRSGWAYRYVALSDGRRQILSYALPGDIIGLHANFRRRASYSAAAMTDVQLAAVEPLRIIEIYQTYPILATGLSWCTAREFAILGDQTVRLGRLAAERRLLHLLLELWHRLKLIGETSDEWMDLPFTQADLADTLGLSTVHLNRQVMRLVRSGLIERDRSWIRLVDVPQLIELAEFQPENLAEFRI